MSSDLPQPFGEWRRKAEANVAEWGWQSKATLLLAATEELGELTQAFQKWLNEYAVEVVSSTTATSAAASASTPFSPS